MSKTNNSTLPEMLLCYFVNDILYFLIITFLTLILKVCIYVGLWTCHAWTAPGLIVSVTTAPSSLAGGVHSIGYHGDERHSICSWHVTFLSNLSMILRVFQVGAIFEHEVGQIPWTLWYLMFICILHTHKTNCVARSNMPKTGTTMARRPQKLCVWLVLQNAWELPPNPESNCFCKEETRETTKTS